LLDRSFSTWTQNCTANCYSPTLNSVIDRFLAQLLLLLVCITVLQTIVWAYTNRPLFSFLTILISLWPFFIDRIRTGYAHFGKNMFFLKCAWTVSFLILSIFPLLPSDMQPNSTLFTIGSFIFFCFGFVCYIYVRKENQSLPRLKHFSLYHYLERLSCFIIPIQVMQYFLFIGYCFHFFFLFFYIQLLLSLASIIIVHNTSSYLNDPFMPHLPLLNQRLTWFIACM